MTTWAIEHGGRDWLFDDQVLMYDDALLQKQVVGIIGDGMEPTPSDIERLRLGRHHQAWLAALVIARMRTGLDREAAAQIDTAQFNLMGIRAVPSSWVVGPDGKAGAPRAQVDAAAPAGDEPEPAERDVDQPG